MVNLSLNLLYQVALKKKKTIQTGEHITTQIEKKKKIKQTQKKS
jgi:hypothetical protein